MNPKPDDSAAAKDEMNEKNAPKKDSDGRIGTDTPGGTPASNASKSGRNPGNFVSWITSSLPSPTDILRRVAPDAKRKEQQAKEDKAFEAGLADLEDPSPQTEPQPGNDKDAVDRLESHIRTTNPPSGDGTARKDAAIPIPPKPGSPGKPAPHPRNMVLPIIDLSAQPPYTPDPLPHELLAARDMPPATELSWWQLAKHTINNFLYPPGPIERRDEPIRWLDHLTRTLYDVKHVVVIGVHGWFPRAAILRIIGEPTGTSPRFVQFMTRAVHDFLFERGVNLPPDSITGIALEGPGRVSERVDALYSQLIRHREALSRADMVFFAAHSQGSVVSVHLLSRIINEGILDPERTRTCLLQMAGISHGPFHALRQNLLIQYFEQDAARELFEYCEDPERDPKSVSAQYQNALDHILSNGVHIVAVGSWFDQVVPLYSALLHRYTHPLLFRAVHISAADYSPDFLTALVTFAVRIRNRGIWDRGLLVHLSEVVAGSLISGTQGHSSVYEEPDVYLLAVQWLLSNHGTVARRPRILDPDDMIWTSQTEMNLRPPTMNPASPDQALSSRTVTPFSNMEVHPPPPIHSSTGRVNPFHLPWIMHELVVAPEIARDENLRRELRSLVEQFRRWAPPDDRKTWKELRWRLEALASVPTAKL